MLRSTCLVNPPYYTTLKILIITQPQFFEGETAMVNALFQHGLERLHLRKPRSSATEMAEWIAQIAPPFRRRIVVHDHYDLALSYGLGGVHLNQRNPLPPVWVEEKGGFTVSRSCHSIQEVADNLDLCDYLTLSPIFDSISKEGYGAAFGRQELVAARDRCLLSDKVYALGGVSAETIGELRDLGFYGAAILGDLWKLSPDIHAMVSRLGEYQYSCLHPGH